MLFGIMDINMSLFKTFISVTLDCHRGGRVNAPAKFYYSIYVKIGIRIIVPLQCIVITS